MKQEFDEERRDCDDCEFAINKCGTLICPFNACARGDEDD